MRNLVLLILNMLCVTAAEIFLTMGAKETAHVAIFGVAAMQSMMTVVGIGFHIAGFVCWVMALRTVPLGLAYNFTCANQVLVPISAWLFLHERVSVQKWFGVSLVVVGIVLLVPLIVETEVQLEGEPASVEAEPVPVPVAVTAE
ncbi:MAG TPA: SMR family transporter [Phycisphaerae bacterium]|nr:SMR family transporter [Phycisphaerae bacterium]